MLLKQKSELVNRAMYFIAFHAWYAYTAFDELREICAKFILR